MIRLPAQPLLETVDRYLSRWPGGSVRALLGESDGAELHRVRSGHSSGWRLSVARRVADRVGTTVESLYQLDVPAETWQDSAACRDADPEVFFEGPFDDARRICNSCPVRDDCLLTAVHGGIRHGIWGGLTYDERRRWARKYFIRNVA